jgi:signal transduction histidine kinase
MVIIFIIGLAIYLYRESTREIREAMQRVTFVNQVSHELKTPLTNIRMYAELLEEQIPEETEKERGYLSIITSESRRLSRLIGNVLTFAREQRNGVSFNPIELMADEAIRSVLENFAPALKTKGIEVETDLRCRRPALIDRDILEQVLSNLVSNVEKYGAEGKLLKVESKRNGEELLLTVRDHGPGIPKSLREKVWKPFFRASNKLTDGVSGTGIGLSIVRTLAKAHGGSAAILPVSRGTAIQVILHAPEAVS